MFRCPYKHRPLILRPRVLRKCHNTPRWQSRSRLCSVSFEKMTTNIYLDSVLSRIPVYAGIYASDQLSSIRGPLAGKLILANTNALEEVETRGHWLAIYFTHNGRAEIFDSLCMDLRIRCPTVVEFCENNASSIIYTPYRIQPANSRLCGIYCIARTLSISLGIALSGFCALFHRDEIEYNDFLLLPVIDRLCYLLSNYNT